MKLPRDLSGDDLAKALGRLGYQLTRQTGAHLRLTTPEHGEHHITIPRHDSLRVGTLSSILAQRCGASWVDQGRANRSTLPIES